MRPRPILLENARLIDGTGAAAVPADILVVDGVVATIGRKLEAPVDCLIIDVADRVVTPGFIDLHSHADMTLIAFPSADSALRQGITTVATGNCGGGVAPLADRSAVNDVAFAYDPSWEIDIDWSGFGGYTSHLDGAGVNVAPLVPHGAVRNAAMGLAARASTAGELDSMCSILSEALDDGAFGLSTGLEYQPGQWATPGEISALVALVGARGRTYATHMRGRADEFETATREALDAAAETDAHLQLSHFAPRPHASPTARRGGFAAVIEAADAGRRVGVDTFPEIWGPALLIDLFPEWVFDGTVAEVLARLADSDLTSTYEKHFDETPGFLARASGYDRIHVTSTPFPASWSGRSLVEVAADLETSVAAAAQKVLVAAQDQYRSVAIRHIYATDDDLEATMRLPYCSIASDGIVTPGEGHSCPMHWNASSYGYVARTIEHHVLGNQLFSLEEAVRRMTALPASQLGINDRGVIKAGAAADLVVIDLENLHDRTTPDDMARHPTGVDYVIVNGGIAVADGVLSPDRHGNRLRP